MAHYQASQIRKCAATQSLRQSKISGGLLSVTILQTDPIGKDLSCGIMKFTVKKR